MNSQTTDLTGGDYSIADDAVNGSYGWAWINDSQRTHAGSYANDFHSWLPILWPGPIKGYSMWPRKFDDWGICKFEDMTGVYGAAGSNEHILKNNALDGQKIAYVENNLGANDRTAYNPSAQTGWAHGRFIEMQFSGTAAPAQSGTKHTGRILPYWLNAARSTFHRIGDLPWAPGGVTKNLRFRPIWWKYANGIETVNLQTFSDWGYTYTGSCDRVTGLTANGSGSYGSQDLNITGWTLGANGPGFLFFNQAGDTLTANKYLLYLGANVFWDTVGSHIVDVGVEGWRYSYVNADTIITAANLQAYLDLRECARVVLSCGHNSFYVGNGTATNAATNQADLEAELELTYQRAKPSALYGARKFIAYPPYRSKSEATAGKTSAIIRAAHWNFAQRHLGDVLFIDGNARSVHENVSNYTNNYDTGQGGSYPILYDNPATHGTIYASFLDAQAFTTAVHAASLTYRALRRSFRYRPAF